MAKLSDIEKAQEVLQQAADQVKQKGKFTASDIRGIRASAQAIKDTSEHIINVANRNRRAAANLLKALDA